MRLAASLIMIGISAGLNAGCASPKVEAAATRAELHNYSRLAVLGLNIQEESLFIAEYMNRFPQQTFVERRDLEALLSEQDLLPGRLNDETRAKLKRVLGVEAIVLADSYPGRSLTVRVVDSETGSIVAQAVLTGKAAIGTGNASSPEMIRKAVKALDPRSS